MKCFLLINCTTLPLCLALAHCYLIFSDEIPTNRLAFCPIEMGGVRHYFGFEFQSATKPICGTLYYYYSFLLYFEVVFPD